MIWLPYSIGCQLNAIELRLAIKSIKEISRIQQNDWNSISQINWAPIEFAKLVKFDWFDWLPLDKWCHNKKSCFFLFVYFWSLFPKDLLILVSSTAVAWEQVGVACSALINVTTKNPVSFYSFIFYLCLQRICWY